jgi:hypothetical protein
VRIRDERRKTRTIGGLGPWSANEEVIGFDVAVDQILFVYGLHTRDLPNTLFRGTAARPKFRAGDAPFAVLPCTLS